MPECIVRIPHTVMLLVEFPQSSHPGPLIGLFIEQSGSVHHLSHILARCHYDLHPCSSFLQ
jgi:hypothetical protein